MSSARACRRLLGSLALADAACLITAALAAIWVHARLSHGTPGDSPQFLSALLLLAGTGFFASLHLYDPPFLLEGAYEYLAVVRGCVYGFAAVSVLSFLSGHPVSREWVGISWLLAAILVVAVRVAVRLLARAVRSRRHLVRHALIVGADSNAVALAARIATDRRDMKVLGFLDDYHPIGTLLLPGLKVLGRPANLQPVAMRLGIQDAIVMPQALPWETLNQLVTAAAVAADGPQVHLSAGFYDLLTTNVRFSERHHVALLTVGNVRLSRRENLLKTMFDYGVAIFVLVGFSPAMAVVAGWQRACGERHLMERSRVLNATGKEFSLLRFRSSAPFHSDFVQKLPGLCNVLTRDMSIVGPRPVPASTSQARGVPMARLRPGLTGSWREVDDPDEQAILDLYYIRAYSMSLDVQVLLKRIRSRLPRRRRSPSPAIVLTVESNR